MPRRPLSEAEWRRSLQRRRMLDAERKRRLRENSAYRVLERARNREARRRQRQNPKFREAERARAHAYYVSLSSTATKEGIICGSCGLILKHVKALRTHRAEFHPRQRMSLDNLYKTPSRDEPPINDSNVNKFIVNALSEKDSDCNDNEIMRSGNQIEAITEAETYAEHSLVDYYGIIFSDVEAALDRMLSYKLNKRRPFDWQTHSAIEAKLKELRQFVLETEQVIESYVTNGAKFSDSSIIVSEEKLSTPSDLLSILREFILHGISPTSTDLILDSGGIKQEPVQVLGGSAPEESSASNNAIKLAGNNSG